MSRTQLSSPPRRWYQFSLRTMLVVVTVACVGVAATVRWVQYSREWIRQRQEFMASDAHGAWTHDTGHGPQTAPGGLWLFGEEGIAEIYIKDERNMPLARELFPEARVHFIGDLGRWLRSTRRRGADLADCSDADGIRIVPGRQQKL